LTGRGKDFVGRIGCEVVAIRMLEHFLISANLFVTR
jgi:hypothetical protein